MHRIKKYRLDINAYKEKSGYEEFRLLQCRVMLVS